MSTPDAGRELDALIAETVMGWSQFPYIVCHASDSGIVQQWGATTVTIHHCPPGAVHVSTIERVPDYSTDIAAAWLVVEKMAAEGFEYEVHGQTWGGREIGRYVWFHKGNLSGQSARNDSTPVAICLAALAALTEGTP